MSRCRGRVAQVQALEKKKNDEKYRNAGDGTAQHQDAFNDLFNYFLEKVLFHENAVQRFR